MKAKNVVIVILIIIILGQLIQFLLLLRKFGRLKFTFEHQPVEVYIAGLTEKLRGLDPLRSEIIWQNRWLSQRLDKCIEMLEQQRGLEPVPVEYPKPGYMSYLKPDPNVAKKYKVEPVPFYEPYEEPNNLSLKDTEEGDVKRLMCLLNLQLLGLKMYLEPSKAQIENYEKRLKRLENHLEK